MISKKGRKFLFYRTLNYSSSLINLVCSQIDSIHWQLHSSYSHLTVMGNNYALSLLKWFEMSLGLRVTAVCQVMLIFFLFLVDALICWPSSWIQQSFSSSSEKNRQLAKGCYQIHRKWNILVQMEIHIFKKKSMYSFLFSNFPIYYAKLIPGEFSPLNLVFNLYFQ